MTIELTVEADEAAVARRAAEWFATAMQAVRAPVAVCLSGGSTPRALYEMLAGDDYRQRLPWQHIHWFWGDERFVDRNDPRSNFAMAKATMLDRAGVPARNIHAVDTSLADPQAAADDYARTLAAFYGSTALVPGRPLFAATLLGLGEDGHTASLFPGSPLLGETQRWVAASIGERPEARVSLTYPALDSSAATAFLACGAGKRAILADIAAGADLPAARVRAAGPISWFVDAAAAGPPSANIAKDKGGGHGS